MRILLLTKGSEQFKSISPHPKIRSEAIKRAAGAYNLRLHTFWRRFPLEIAFRILMYKKIEPVIDPTQKSEISGVDYFTWIVLTVEMGDYDRNEDTKLLVYIHDYPLVYGRNKLLTFVGYLWNTTTFIYPRSFCHSNSFVPTQRCVESLVVFLTAWSKTIIGFY